MADLEKEEIIELTEVVEEKEIPAEAVEGESSFLSEPKNQGQGLIEEESREERPEGDRPAPIQNDGEKVSPSIEEINRKAEEWAVSEGVQVLERVAGEILPGIASEILEKEVVRLRGEVEDLRAEKEALKVGADQWLNAEGVKILGQGTREILPKIAAEVLGTEVEKFRGEVEGLRAEKEKVQAGVEKWLGSEGVRLLEQIVTETLPRIAGEVLGKEIGKINQEVEGLRAEKEALMARSEQWLGSAGVKVLEEQTREILPGIAADALGKEVEKFNAAVEELRAEKEALKMKADQWLNSEGIGILKQEAGAIFPRIAEEVLSREIEKLKKEEETEEEE